MKHGIAPIEKTNLADDVASRVMELIDRGGYNAGDRLPSIMEMARALGVGHPTLREALMKLELIGVVEIKHGSGVYVGEKKNTLLLSNPVFGGDVTKKLLLDLIQARIPIETTSARLAAMKATDSHLARMEEFLQESNRNLSDDAILTRMNMAFHREIAVASGNTVLLQLQEVLTNFFGREQRILLGVHGSRGTDHEQHLDIFEALRSRMPDLAAVRMESHLEGVYRVVEKWDPEKNPIANIRRPLKKR